MRLVSFSSGLLACSALASAVTIPHPHQHKKRSPEDLLHNLATKLQGAIPNVTAAGVALVNQTLSGASVSLYTLPKSGPSSVDRKKNLDLVRTNFLYGPPVGGGPQYPTGLLGSTKNVLDVVSIQNELGPRVAGAAADLAKAAQGAGKVS